MLLYIVHVQLSQAARVTASKYSKRPSSIGILRNLVHSNNCTYTAIEAAAQEQNSTYMHVQRNAITHLMLPRRHTYIHFRLAAHKLYTVVAATAAVTAVAAAAAYHRFCSYITEYTHRLLDSLFVTTAYCSAATTACYCCCLVSDKLEVLVKCSYIV
jgi:hypothetical protein